MNFFKQVGMNQADIVTIYSVTHPLYVPKSKSSQDLDALIREIDKNAIIDH